MKYVMRLNIYLILFMLFSIAEVAAGSATELTTEEVESRINAITRTLKEKPGDANLYVQRGDYYFIMHEFQKALEDYTKAIQLDKRKDKAYFGRGMALGRLGRIEEGIQDLTVYIKRNPKDSRAYTKRGVRYLWLGKIDMAEKDLRMAILLDKNNAEAHDDLGVILAQRKEYSKAIQHFTTTIQIDGFYQKAYHNLSMVYYLTGRDQDALVTINAGLKLYPSSRNSLLLKAQILKALGRISEARVVYDEAEFLPEGNWSERVPVKK